MSAYTQGVKGITKRKTEESSSCEQWGDSWTMKMRTAKLPRNPYFLSSPNCCATDSSTAMEPRSKFNDQCGEYVLRQSLLTCLPSHQTALLHPRIYATEPPLYCHGYREPLDAHQIFELSLSNLLYRPYKDFGNTTDCGESFLNLESLDLHRKLFPFFLCFSRWNGGLILSRNVSFFCNILMRW